MGRLDGKVALVTGAARGQGRSHAVRMAQEGADIIAVDVCAPLATVPYDLATEADLDETVRLVEEEGRRIVHGIADTRDLDALSEIVDRGVEDLGHLDVVCANAGIVSFGGIRETDLESWRAMIDVNLTGTFTTAKASVEHLVASGGGAFIAVSSVYGLRGLGGAVQYAAAKHGVTGLVRAMAHDLAPYDVRVNSVHPTSVATPMVLNDTMLGHFRPDLEAPTFADTEEGFMSINLQPVAVVEAVDVSHAIVYLASDEARYLTGVALPVDAGATQK